MMLPEGDYRAVAILQTTDAGDVTYAQFGETKNQKAYVALIFEVTGGDYKGHRIQWFGYFVPASTKRTVETLRTCGFRGDDLMAATIQELKEPVVIVIGHEEYMGKISAKVKWVNRPGSAGIKIKAMNANDLRRLAGNLKGAVKDVPEIEAGKPVAPPSQSADPADGVGDDDAINF